MRFTGALLRSRTRADENSGIVYTGGGARAAGIPDVMTPSEAAGILKVSEEDVLAAIQDGSLKAKKLGNAYRISKESLETFLKS